MKKLLHERLREIDENHTDEIKVQGVDIRLFPVEGIALADEIEYHYIPKRDLDKLRDDMRKYLDKGLFDPEKQYLIALNRLSALIERDA